MKGKTGNFSRSGLLCEGVRRYDFAGGETVVQAGPQWRLLPESRLHLRRNEKARNQKLWITKVIQWVAPSVPTSSPTL